MSRNIAFFGQNTTTTLSPSFTLNDFQFDRIYSLRKVYDTATSSVRIRRSNDLTETDIGFVGQDLDTSAINTFCNGTSCVVMTFYDQSGNSNAIQFNTPAIIYESGSIPTIDGKISCVFGSTGRTQYDFTRLENINSVFFVAQHSRDTTFSFVLYDASTTNGLSINTSQEMDLGWRFSNKGRGISYLAGRNLASTVYDETALLYSINRNGDPDTFGDKYLTGTTASDTTDRLASNTLGRFGSGQALAGNFQEILIAASGSNANLTNKDIIIDLINDYWTVY